MIWEAGTLRLPTSPDAIDRIEMKTLKRKITEVIDKAWHDKKPFRSKNSNGRKVQISLPKELREERKMVVMKAFYNLVSDGEITHIERKGYCVAK